jgi:hypothetical protein
MSYSTLKSFCAGASVNARFISHEVCFAWVQNKNYSWKPKVLVSYFTDQAISTATLAFRPNREDNAQKWRADIGTVFLPSLKFKMLVRYAHGKTWECMNHNLVLAECKSRHVGSFVIQIIRVKTAKTTSLCHRLQRLLHSALIQLRHCVSLSISQNSFHRKSANSNASNLWVDLTYVLLQSISENIKTNISKVSYHHYMVLKDVQIGFPCRENATGTWFSTWCYVI